MNPHSVSLILVATTLSLVMVSPFTQLISSNVGVNI
jgi:hypothetical protein